MINELFNVYEDEMKQHPDVWDGVPMMKDMIKVFPHLLEIAEKWMELTSQDLSDEECEDEYIYDEVTMTIARRLTKEAKWIPDIDEDGNDWGEWR